MFNSRAREYLSYRERNTFRSSLFRLVRIVLLLVVVYLIVTHFLVTARTVGSASMEPTIAPGDRLITTPLTYGPTVPFSTNHLPGLAAPSRGDLVVMTPPYYERPPLLVQIADPIVRFFTLQHVTLIRPEASWDQPLMVRRVIGTPGDTVRMKDFTFYVRPKGESAFVPEFQLSPSIYRIERQGLPAGWSDTLPLSGSVPPVTLGPSQYFVAADSRVGSIDSRSFGVVGIRQIREKVLLRYYPFGRFGLLK
ncbi:signal peptidase I [Salinispira pacifica]